MTRLVPTHLVHPALVTGLLFYLAHSTGGSPYWAFIALLPVLRAIRTNATVGSVIGSSMLASLGPAFMIGESILWDYPLAFAGVWILHVPQLALPLLAHRQISHRGKFSQALTFAAVWLIWEQLWLAPTFIGNYTSVYSLGFVFASGSTPHWITIFPLPLITFIILASNLLLSSVEFKQLLPTGLCLATAILALTYLPSSNPVSAQTTDSVELALLQPALTTEETQMIHLFDAFAHSYMKEFATLIQLHRAGPQLVILPETALPTTVSQSELGSLIDDLPGVEVLAGAVWGNGNSVIQFADGQIEEVHRKVQLIPLHETSIFKAGVAVSTVELPSGLVVGILICLDGINPWLVTETVRAGAQLIVVVNGTNYGRNSTTPRLQFRLSSLLALRHRIPMVIVASNGPSGYVSNTGNIIEVAEGVQTLLRVTHEY